MGWIFLLIGLILLLVAGVIFLFLYDKKIKEELSKKKVDPKLEYLLELEKIKNFMGDKGKTVSSLDSLARKVFQRFYSISEDREYSDIEEEFKLKENKTGEVFSRLMITYMYSEKNLNEVQLMLMFELLDTLIKTV